MSGYFAKKIWEKGNNMKGDVPDFLSDQKEKWDSLACENGLKAVISGDVLNNYYFDMATKNILKHVMDLKEDYNVLDYGCGVGRISNWIATEVNEVLGVDISPNMIETAKGNADNQNLENVKYRVIDGENLSFKSGFYDLVICCGALKYIINDEHLNHVMGNLAEALKNRGNLIIIDEFDENGPKPINEAYSGNAILRKPDQYSEILNEFNLHLENEYSIYQNLISRYYKKFASITGINNNKLLKAVIDMDLFVDNILKGYKTEKGFHLLYFQKNK